MEARKLRQPDSEPFQLSLRIRHPSVDPDELSREFSIEAAHCFRAGDPRASRTGIASVHPESYWLGALSAANWPVDVTSPGALRLLAAQERLGVVATRSLGWALSLSTRRIVAESGQVSLLITAPAGELSGFSLAPAVSRVFSELGITLEFEFTSD